MMSKSQPPPAEYYAPPPPNYHPHGYPPPHDYHHPGHPSHPVMNQPMTQSTNVVVNTGGAGGVGTQVQKRPWTTNLCGCFEDMEVCLCAWCATPCFLVQLTMQMNECCCTPFCIPEALMAMRVKVREANKIQGTICEDFFCTCFCPLLTMCQMKRELNNIALKKPGTVM